MATLVIWIAAQGMQVYLTQREIDRRKRRTRRIEDKLFYCMECKPNTGDPDRHYPCRKCQKLIDEMTELNAYKLEEKNEWEREHQKAG